MLSFCITNFVAVLTESTVSASSSRTESRHHSAGRGGGRFVTVLLT